MSSIRDALRKAERERQAREQGQAGASPVAPAPTAPPTEAGPAIAPFLEIPPEFVEEMALLRRGIESALPQPRRSIMLSSATGGEGTTTITCLLSASLALRDGRKTCVVDLNFKSPRLSQLFGLEGRPGLSEYCMGRAELDAVLVRSQSPDLVILPIGNERTNPSLVLSHERARKLASDLSAQFDYVLFDTGSILGCAEASMLVENVDGVLLVVRANRTKREVLGKADQLIRYHGGQVLGTVLNRRTFPIPGPIYKRL